MRVRDGVQVYRQRQNWAQRLGTPPPSYPVIESPNEREFKRYGSTASVDQVHDNQTSWSSWSSLGMKGDTIMEKLRPHGVTLMALHGTLDGTLEDCMFGCVAPTDDAWMLRSSHLNDGVDDSRIIAALRRPTSTDPCCFLGVKWFLKAHPALITGFVQKRDFLLLEATGYTQDTSGEKVGYVLLHSITLRDLPELAHLGIVRGLIRFCYIFRQNGSGKIDIFCRGYFDSRGDMPRRLSVSIAAEATIAVVGVVDYAHVKKLIWLIRHSRKQVAVDATNASCCGVCAKNFSKLFFHSSAPCQICHRVICFKCTVLKKMTVHVATSGKVLQRSFRFCLQCLLQATQMSGWDMAISNVEASSTSSS